MLSSLLADAVAPDPGKDQKVILTPGGTEGKQFQSPVDFTLGNIISFAITASLIIAGIIFFFMLVIGGIQWITAGGDKANAEGARGRITAALIGLVIVFAAFAIVNLLSSVFGINLFTLNIGKISNS